MGRIGRAVGGAAFTAFASLTAGTITHEVLDQDFYAKLAEVEACEPFLPEQGTAVVPELAGECVSWAHEMKIDGLQPDSPLPKSKQNYRLPNRQQFHEDKLSKLQKREDLQTNMSEQALKITFGIGALVTVVSVIRNKQYGSDEEYPGQH